MNYLNGAQNGLDKELKKWELDLRYIWYKKFDLIYWWKGEKLLFCGKYYKKIVYYLYILNFCNREKYRIFWYVPFCLQQKTTCEHQCASKNRS